MDKQLVRRASRSRWGALLEAGVEIAEYQPTMYHCKLMIVDDLWVSVGSANFDNRSLELNDELNVVAFDSALASRLTADFERDITRSTRIDAGAVQPNIEPADLADLIGAALKSTEKQTTEKIRELITKVGDPRFVAKAALYARNTYGMRSVSHLVA